MFRTVAILVLFAATAHADDWSHTVDHVSANASSVRVVEPEGYTVTINGRTDSIPAVFNVPNADNYFVLVVASPQGTTFERKIEVKQYRQSVVRIRHSAAAKPAPAKQAAATYIGVLANTSHLCARAEHRRAVRLEFTAGAETVQAVELAARSRQDVRLPANNYQVRTFVAGANGWEFESSRAYSVTKDGWVFEYGCAK